MPKITDIDNIGAAIEKVNRLGLLPLLEDLKSLLTEFELRVKEAKDANGGAAVRKIIDARFEHQTGWTKKQTGDVDWTKCKTVNGTRVCMGVEIQFSARSDLLVID